MAIMANTPASAPTADLEPTPTQSPSQPPLQPGLSKLWEPKSPSREPTENTFPDVMDAGSEEPMLTPPSSTPLTVNRGLSGPLFYKQTVSTPSRVTMANFCQDATVVLEEETTQTSHLSMKLTQVTLGLNGLSPTLISPNSDLELFKPITVDF